MDLEQRYQVKVLKLANWSIVEIAEFIGEEENEIKELVEIFDRKIKNERPK